MDEAIYREQPVTPGADGMRLDRFLALRFRDRSRSWLARGIGEGRVRDEQGTVLRKSTIVRAGQVLRLYLEEIAPSSPPPPFPEVLYEDDRVAAVNKPSGLMAHPSGTRWAWALIGLARTRWPAARIDLVHRLDRDTSGVILLTKDAEANTLLKRAFFEGDCRKVYRAIVKGVPAWDAQVVDAPIDRAGGPIRIQMGVGPDGQPARTDIAVEARHPSAPLSLVQCRIHTGRTHQIRVHLAHVGLPILGDVLYGVPPEVFLTSLETGLTDDLIRQTGAARHALHAAHLTFPHPEGHEVSVESPLPRDMAGWWADPSSLPWMSAVREDPEHQDDDGNP